MNKAIDSLAGRFTLVHRIDGLVVIGFVGTVEARSLTLEQVAYIRSFYHAAGVAVKMETYLDGHFPRNNYNDFLAFDSREIVDSKITCLNGEIVADKALVMYLANKGAVKFDGATISIEIQQSEAWDEDVVWVRVHRLNQNTTDALMGGCFVRDVLESDCKKMLSEIKRHVRKMETMGERGKRNPIHIEQVAWNEVVTEWKERYGFEQYKDEHFSLYSMGRDKEWVGSVALPVILDGVLYQPVYSFYLQRTVYLIQSPEGYFTQA